MPNRLKIGLLEIANYSNLNEALYLAANGRRSRRHVSEFLRKAPARLGELSRQLITETWRPSRMSEFVIFDPKRRVIHAPPFSDRVVHHALMLQVGEHLDRMQVDDSFACRIGKGPLRAVQRAQEFTRKFPWYVKMDITSYFHSIDHHLLMEFLSHRLGDPGVLRLFSRIVAGFNAEKDRGLPIGALTSQHLANLYLATFDRAITGRPQCRAYVRYMDDMVVWCHSRTDAIYMEAKSRELLGAIWDLKLKKDCEINRSSQGLTFCGYRIFPGIIRLTKRKKRIYRRIVSHWETQYLSGRATMTQLQAGFASALAAVQAADCLAWRRREAVRSLVDD